MTLFLPLLTILALAGCGKKPEAWEYTTEDITVEHRLSGQMQAHDSDALTRSLNLSGKSGWELAAALPIPADPEALKKRTAYRLVFKRPSPAGPLPDATIDESRLKQAIEAESKAEQQQFERRLEKIGQPR